MMLGIVTSQGRPRGHLNAISGPKLAFGSYFSMLLYSQLSRAPSIQPSFPLQKHMPCKLSIFIQSSILCGVQFQILAFTLPCSHVAARGTGGGGLCSPQMKILTTTCPPLATLFPNDILKSWHNYKSVGLI